jgi:hypothetical protein
MTLSLEVKEGQQLQSADEEIAYSITTTPWGSSPATISAKAFDIDQGETDVTTTVFPTNTPTAVGDVITLSALKALTKGRTYRVEVKFTAGGQVFEPYFYVRCIV